MSEGKVGLSTPQVHQLKAAGNRCLRNEGKRPGKGLCCDVAIYIEIDILPSFWWERKERWTDIKIYGPQHV